MARALQLLVASVALAACASSTVVDESDAEPTRTSEGGSEPPPRVDAAPIDAGEKETAPTRDASPDGAADAAPDGALDAAPPPDAGPVALSFGAPTSTTQHGSPTGGAPFDDACPGGHAIIGFTGSLTSASGYHGQIAARCGALARAGVAGAFSVRVTSSVTLPTRGRLSGSAWSRECPADQVVVGFGGRAGALVDQLSFSCAPLSVDPAGTAVTVGAATLLPSVGGGGGSAFAQTDCGAGRVATVARIRAGDGIDAFGLGCGLPSAPP